VKPIESYHYHTLKLKLVLTDPYLTLKTPMTGWDTMFVKGHEFKICATRPGYDLQTWSTPAIVMQD